MKYNKTPERKSPFRTGLTLSAAALLLTGCSNGKSTPDTDAVAQTSPSPEVPSGTTDNQTRTTRAEDSNKTTLVFDDLNGGSSVISVYPGAQDRAIDKEANGTYYDGDRTHAECKTEGREVSSDPNAGEVNRTSTAWVRIDGIPGETQYATAVYIRNPEQLLSQLPDC